MAKGKMPPKEKKKTIGTGEEEEWQTSWVCFSKLTFSKWIDHVYSILMDLVQGEKDGVET